ncbi:hypothetical protein BN12_250013 [Nostocoides japonicum T1-X7]|uniref:Uncharacterized protein n=1 Tax=Nostocoides japonicum T1-X7 TaxID=1194083 RepID=A0A077LYV3_9MICO|nr:hypothetical protein BN12_250013 [Tetrasphaera japonica T1-X7]
MHLSLSRVRGQMATWRVNPNRRLLPT